MWGFYFGLTDMLKSLRVWEPGKYTPGIPGTSFRFFIPDSNSLRKTLMKSLPLEFKVFNVKLRNGVCDFSILSTKAFPFRRWQEWFLVIYRNLADKTCIEIKDEELPEFQRFHPFVGNFPESWQNICPSIFQPVSDSFRIIAYQFWVKHGAILAKL